VAYTFGMAIKDSLLPEFDHEMGTTRRVLERVPQADLAWKPHAKSFSLGQLASHLADIPTWVDVTFDVAVFDIAAIDTRPKLPADIAPLLTAFDANVKKARARIAEQPDQAFFATWTLKKGGEEVFTMPKIAVLRSFVMNHLIHHRGQMSVYLRLRDVPLPSIYGPTADEG
jgi:uncharacterized damage-inducible protein DinB